MQAGAANIAVGTPGHEDIPAALRCRDSCFGRRARDVPERPVAGAGLAGARYLACTCPMSTSLPLPWQTRHCSVFGSATLRSR